MQPITIYIDSGGAQRQRARPVCRLKKKIIVKVWNFHDYYIILQTEMTTRREKNKSKKSAEMKTAVQENSIDDSLKTKSRKEKLSNYLIDISKYVMTGVVIASLFRDLDDNRLLLYLVGLFIAFMALGVGLVLTDKKERK
jgi:hypothetical protein